MTRDDAWEVGFYQTRRGESPIDDFLQRLSTGERAKCILYMLQLEASGGRLPEPYAKKVEGGVWELRPEYAGVAFRFFYFTVVAGQIVVVHAISKKTQRLKRKDIDLALRRVADVRQRIYEVDTGKTGVQDAPPIRRRSDRG